MHPYPHHYSVQAAAAPEGDVHVTSAGLPGLAIMPPILSIPITAVIAAKYFHHDRRTLPVLLAAVSGWSVVLSTVWSFMR